MQNGADTDMTVSGMSESPKQPRRFEELSQIEFDERFFAGCWVTPGSAGLFLPDSASQVKLTRGVFKFILALYFYKNEQMGYLAV
jgi:hypothetical protein